MSDFVDRVRGMVEAHKGKLTAVTDKWLEFEVRTDFAIGLMPQLNQDPDCIPILLGTETRLGPRMREINGQWVEIPPPCIPGAKLAPEQYPVYVYRVRMPKRKTDAART